MRVHFVAVGLLATVVVIAPVSSEAASMKQCGNVRIDRALRRAADGDFGAFKIRAERTSCRRARQLAARYVQEPSFPTRIGRWRCTPRTIANQVLKVRCRLGGARVSFRDVVPSG